VSASHRTEWCDDCDRHVDECACTTDTLIDVVARQAELPKLYDLLTAQHAKLEAARKGAA
jgi:hypothetical protein